MGCCSSPEKHKNTSGLGVLQEEAAGAGGAGNRVSVEGRDKEGEKRDLLEVKRRV